MSREAWIVVGVVVAIVGIITLIGAVKLATRLWAAKKSLNELGAGGTWAFWGALAYTIFPIDVLPDPIYLDDMAVLSGALLYLTKLIQRKRAARGLPVQRSEASQIDQRRS